MALGVVNTTECGSTRVCAVAVSTSGGGDKVEDVGGVVPKKMSNKRLRKMKRLREAAAAEAAICTAVVEAVDAMVLADDGVADGVDAVNTGVDAMGAGLFDDSVLGATLMAVFA